MIEAIIEYLTLIDFRLAALMSILGGSFFFVIMYAKWSTTKMGMMISVPMVIVGFIGTASIAVQFIDKTAI